jgi:hypothetical protein
MGEALLGVSFAYVTVLWMGCMNTVFQFRSYLAGRWACLCPNSSLLSW